MRNSCHAYDVKPWNATLEEAYDGAVAEMLPLPRYCMSDYSPASSLSLAGHQMEELLSWAGRTRASRIVTTRVVGRRLLVSLHRD
jgi:hypothetical protein